MERFIFLLVFAVIYFNVLFLFETLFLPFFKWIFCKFKRSKYYDDKELE